MNQSKAETSWSQEKQKLVRKIIESKEEHQQCILHLKEKSHKFDLLALEKTNMEKLHAEQINSMSDQLNTLQIEREDLKTQYSKKESEDGIYLKKKSREFDLLVSEKLKMEKLHAEQLNSMSDQLNALQIETKNLKKEYSKKESENITLSHENQMLKARVKQLQTSHRQTINENETAQTNSENQPATYEMEKIVDHKIKKDGLHFRVRWKGYSTKDDTYEHESSLMCTLCEYKKNMNLN